MGQVASYVAQNESQYQFPNYNGKDSRVYQKSKPMLELIFGWRDAAECKKVIKETHSDLKQLKDKRFSTVKYERDKIEKLIKAGKYETAFDRVEQVYKDECMVAVYDLLAQFCERIIFHLSHIRRNKSCPKDVMEAISSLIFASTICGGDLPKLLHIRKLFIGRYGNRLETDAVNLLPGNHVNIQIIEKLSSIDQLVSDKVKHKLLKEIKSNMNQAVSANTTKQIANPLDLDTDSEFTSDSSTEDIHEGIHEFKSPLHKGCDQRGFLFISSPHHITHNIARRHSVSSADNEKNMPLYTGRRSVSSAMERALSLACERTTTPLHEKNLGKSSSCLPPLSPHVQPKLTEYDVIPYEKNMTLSTRRHSVSSADNEKNMPLSTGRRSVSSAMERAMSLACERTKTPLHEKTLGKSSSLPPLSPHIQPKLPDFEVIPYEKNMTLSTRRRSFSSADNEKKMPLSTGRRSVSSAIERGMSLPCERTTTPLHEKTLGKPYSLPPLSPHVHPKLTEFDAIPYEKNMPLSTRRHSVSSADNEKYMPLSTGRRSVSSAIERAMSLPCEHATTPLHGKNLQKSYSLPLPSPHVHPNLPDCDVIHAMFMDLKKKKM